MNRGGQQGSRFVAWALVMASASAAPCIADPDSAPAARECRLRVACFNAENLAIPGETTRITRFRFEPARRRHLERIAAVVETLAPDILVMPEVVSGAAVEAVTALLEAKGMPEYRGYHVEGADIYSGFDVAVFSRIVPDELDGERIRIFVPARRPGRGRDAEPAPAPVANADDAWLQESYKYMDERGNARSETAVLQRHAVAYFTVCGRKIAVLGMHLKSNPSDVGSNAQRTAETRIARDLIRRKIVARGYLPIVLGDLNDYDPDVPMADASRTTQTTVLRDLKDYDHSVAGPELVNAARHVARVADRYTSHWDFNENGVADAEDVFTMIDHVLVHRDLEPAIRRAFICHALDLDVSDHFPVVVDLDLGRLP